MDFLDDIDGSDVGDETLENLRQAFRAEGWDVDDDGTLQPLVLDGLSGAEYDRALHAYVRRAQKGAADAALVTGTGKDLLEAAARRVIHNKGGAYSGADFPGTLFNAFYAAGLAPPSQAAINAFNRELSGDERTRLHESLFLAALAVNRLRNAQGAGHGRPFPPTVTDAEAKAATKLMGLVSEFLLSMS